MANTYGTWPAGDARGFRTRHHREHIEGDYKKPPPAGRYDGWLKRSLALMKRDAVLLPPAARVAAVGAILGAMRFHQIEVLAVAVSDKHLHMLARFPRELKQKPTLSKRGLRTSALDDPPRHYLGIAKKECSKKLAELELAPPGGVWAKRGKVKPCEGSDAQVNALNYIVEHYHEGAAVWCHLYDGVRIDPQAR